MTRAFKIFLQTIFFGQLCIFSYGQQKDSLDFNNMTVARIDSICNSIDSNKTHKNVGEGISEGKFINGGGYSTYALGDKDSDTLYRIRYNSSTDLYYETIFYYEDKKVIKAMITIEDWNSGKAKIIYSTSYYFDNNKTIKTIGENIKYSNATNILKEGLRFQEEYYKEVDKELYKK